MHNKISLLKRYTLYILVLTCTFCLQISFLNAASPTTGSIAISHITSPTSTLSKGDRFSLSIDFYSTSSDLSLKSIQLSGEAVDTTTATETIEKSSGEQYTLNSSLIAGELMSVSYSDLIYTGSGNEFKITFSGDGFSSSETITLTTLTNSDVQGALLLDPSSNSNMSASIKSGETKELSLTIKNVTSETIKNGKAKVYFDETTVGLSITAGQYTDISSMNAGTTKKITFTVNADSTVKAGTYPITIELNSMKQKIYLEVGSLSTPPILELSIDATQIFKLGEVNTLNLKLQNTGGKSAQNIKIEVVNQTDAAVVGNSNVKYIDTLLANSSTSYQTKLQLNTKTSSDLLRLELMLTYYDESGEKYTDTQFIYLNTNTVSSPNDLKITNIIGPSGTYAPNQDFTIKFKISSTNGAENVKVSVNTPNNIIPTSQSVFVLTELAAHQSKEYTVTFRGTDAISTSTYPIEILLEYDYQDKAFSMNQYTSVNISNEDTDEAEDLVSPKVILSHSLVSPQIVQASESVNLDLTFLNTHANKKIYNLTATLNLNNSKTSDASTATSVFSIVDASNTLFTSSLSAGTATTHELTLNTSSGATAQTYEVSIDISYQDEDGHEITSSATLPITITQEVDLDIAQIDLSTLTIGRATALTATIYNTSKFAVNNVMMYLESEALGTGFTVTDNKSYLSSFSMGGTEYYAPSLTGITAGIYATDLVIEYEDSLGIQQTLRYPFQVIVDGGTTGRKNTSGEMTNMSGENMPSQMGNGMNKNMPNSTNGNFSTPMVIGIVLGVAVALMVLIVFLKKRKIKKGQEFND